MQIQEWIKAIPESVLLGIASFIASKVHNINKELMSLSKAVSSNYVKIQELEKDVQEVKEDFRLLHFKPTRR